VSQAQPLACSAKGTGGGGAVRVHARTERRYRCRTCRRTCAATTTTPLYRLHHPEATLALTLLLHGCPIAAVVAAFGLDERTVRAWLRKVTVARGCTNPRPRVMATIIAQRRWKARPA